MVEKALREMDVDLLRKYPDPACSILVQALSDAYGLPKECIFTGVGSDDVLAMCFLTFFNGKEPVLFPDITYSFYEVWAELFRVPYRCVPLDEDFRIRPEDYRIPNGGVIFPNPNAPTGVLLPFSVTEQMIREHPESIVIVDEAYIDFGGESALPLLERYDNLVVIQTFSKSRSLAGMRIGAAFASPELIRALNDVKYSFNSYTMNTPALLAGEAALRDQEYFRETCERIMATRARVSEPLRELGFTFSDSASNFLFVKHRTCPAKELFTALKKENIYVRHFSRPRINDYLRITIGTDAEMDELIRFLRSYLSE